MGRTTPPLRTIVREYTERFRRVAELLPPEDRVLIEKYLEDLDSTLSIYMHVGSVDPLEVFLLHLVRKAKDLCSCSSK